MHPDVVITTHRDLVALAPQPLYLAIALANRGVNVELVSNARAELRQRLQSEKLRMYGPSDRLKEPRLRLATIWSKSIRRLLTTKIGVALDLNAVWPVAFARRFHGFATVLYWLEVFYGEYGALPSSAASLGRRSLDGLLPPNALIDVDPRRLQISRELCKEPTTSFVLRNVPPLAFGRHRSPKDRSDGINLVYSGSVTGFGAEGIEHMVRAVAISKRALTLTIFPAEGRSATAYLSGIVRALGAGERIIFKERLDRSHISDSLVQFDAGVVLYPVRPGQDNNSEMAAPNKLYEYLASGISIIASNNETMQFISREGLGWNIAATSLDETAEFLNSLNRTEIEARCQRAATAFRERYNYESQAEPVLQWFVAQLRGYS
jgi:hypothetical protein